MFVRYERITKKFADGILTGGKKVIGERKLENRFMKEMRLTKVISGLNIMKSLIFKYNMCIFSGSI
jgi:hypothetical protein